MRKTLQVSRNLPSQVVMTWERRSRLAHLIAAGLPLVEAVKLTSEEYSKKPEQIYEDWRGRKKWLPVLLQLGKDEKTIKEALINLFMDLREVRQELKVTYAKADNSNARVGALNALAATVEKEVQLRQSLGLMEQAPMKIETSGTQGIIVQMWLPEKKGEKDDKGGGSAQSAEPKSQA